VTPDPYRGARRLLAVLLIGSLPVLADPLAIARVASLWPAANGIGAYFIPSHGLLLYLWSPLVVLSSLFLFLAPGLVLAFGFGPRHPGAWVLAALAWSTLVISLAAAIPTTLLGWSPTGRGFVLLVLGLTIGCLAAIVPVLRRRTSDDAPWAAPTDRHALLSMLVVPLLLLIALTPKFYWEAFNGDGAHAYESARLLLRNVVPFWSPLAGPVAHYPGFKTFLSSYPLSWFIRLFGEYEAAARLPYLLVLVALYAGLVTLIDLGRTQSVTAVERWLPWLGLVVYSVVMAFSATYSPYHADLALPATQDTLCLAFFVGFTVAALQGRSAAAAAFAVLTYVTSPAGLILLGLWCGASVLVLRPIPWRMLMVAAASLIGCTVLERLAPSVTATFGLAAPGEEHRTGALVERLLFLQWRDWHRFLYLILPSGILPAMALVAWWRQDRIARVTSVVAVGLFSFFYLQARISLHYFVPAMVLPIAVLARDPWFRTPVTRRWCAAGAAAAAMIALWISLPPDPAPRLRSRVVGSALEDRLGGYDTMEARAFARLTLLDSLFPRPGAPEVPEKVFGGSPLEWSYYAHRGVRAGAPAYILIGAQEPAPIGAILVARDAEAALYVLDASVWADHRAPQPGWTGIAPVYRIRKRTLFHG
jgi:hypothetical protein